MNQQRLIHMLRAEASAERWFQALSEEEQQTYARAHPLSKFANHISSLPGHIQRKYHALTGPAKQAIQSWHGKSPQQKMQQAREGVVHATKRAVHHVGHELHHEAKMYHGASKAIAHLATGGRWKDMHPEHKKHLKSALVHAGITAGSLAMGDATGGSGISAIGHVAGAFAAEHANHSALIGGAKVAAKTGRDFLKKAVAADNDNDPRKKQQIEREAERALQALIRADIPISEWIEIVHEIERIKAKQDTNQ